MKDDTYNKLVAAICQVEAGKVQTSVGNVREVLSVVKHLKLKHKLVLVRYLFGAQND